MIRLTLYVQMWIDISLCVTGCEKQQHTLLKDKDNNNARIQNKYTQNN